MYHFEPSDSLVDHPRLSPPPALRLQLRPRTASSSRVQGGKEVTWLLLDAIDARDVNHHFDHITAQLHRLHIHLIPSVSGESPHTEWREESTGLESVAM